MRIGVFHDSLNFAGGAERVCLKTIEGLKEGGDEVVLGTIEPTDWAGLQDTMGWKTKPHREMALLPFGTKRLRLYMSTLGALALARLRGESDLCVGTNGDLMPLDTDVSYMHYLPTCLSLRGAGEEFSKLVASYMIPFDFSQRLLLRRFRGRGLVANSSFTRDAIKARMGFDSQVIYPPVEIEAFAPARGVESRDNTVVACGRLSPEKNFELVLAVAALLPQTDFVILGTVSGGLSRSYYDKLQAMKESNHLANVTIMNSTFSKMLSTYSTAKVFLSAMAEESFGLSVAEAMASGLVPVVRDSGGPWKDILEAQEGEYGFSFSSAREAAAKIERMTGDDSSRREIVARNDVHVRRFSATSFKAEMRKVVQREADERSGGAVRRRGGGHS